MATVSITNDNFNDTIKNNPIVFVDFWAEWCGPCKAFAPVYEAVSEKYDDVVFAKVDTENAQELAAHFQIRSIPTLMAFREEVVLFSQAGMLSESQLEEVVEKIRAVDMAEVHAEIKKEG